MGFGYLLIGYIVAFLFSISNIYFFADVIGGVVMLIAFTKLGWHQKNFLRALWADMVYLLLCFARAVLMLLRVIESDSAPATAASVAILLSSLVLHVFLLAGIYHLAVKVEVEKEARRARRNLLLIFTYYPMVIILSLLSPWIPEKAAPWLSLAVFLYGAFVVLSNTYLIYCCYCRIVVRGEEQKETPPSRFAWLNRWNEKADSLLDGAYRTMSKKKTEEPKEQEAGYLRVKRKKKKGRK